MMKLTIGDYEVNISAKVLSNKMNKKDTMYFLNDLAICFQEASIHIREKGYNAIADEYNEMFQNVHDRLSSENFFDKEDK